MVTRLITEDELEFNADSLFNPAFPILPENVADISAIEKARLYNQLINQGFTDSEIRQAAGAQNDSDWSALKQIAANLQNPAATMSQEQPIQQRFSGLFMGGDKLAEQAQQVLESSGKANDPRYTDAIVGTFTKNGVIYNVQGDGSIQGFIETPTGAYLSAGFTPEGQQATEQFSNKFEQSSTDRLLGTLANAAIAAGTGLALGPAGIGFLGAPAAAATGAGITNFANTGDLKAALTAAALGGASAYGVQGIMSGLNASAYDQAFAAADAAQLANQGLDAATIAQNISTYVDPTTAVTIANAAVEQTFALADANQLINQGLAPTQVAEVLQASGVSPNIAMSAAQAAAEGVTEISPTDLISNIKYQPQTGQSMQATSQPNAVEVVGQRLTETAAPTVTAPVSGLLASAVAPTPTETQAVRVEAPRVAAVQPLSLDSASSLLSAVLNKPVKIVDPAQQVEVSGQRGVDSYSPAEATELISSLLGIKVSLPSSAPVAPVAPAAPVAPEVVSPPPVVAETAPVTEQVTVAAPAVIENLGALSSVSPILSTLVPQQVEVMAPAQEAQQEAAPIIPEVVSVAPPAPTPVAPEIPVQQVEVMAPQQPTVTEVAPVTIPITTPVAPEIPMQQVEVMAPQQPTVTEVAPEIASSILSNILGQSVVVEGAPQQVEVIGQPQPQEIPAETAAALLSSVVGQQVTITAQPEAVSTAPETVGGMLSNIVQTVPVEAPAMQPPTQAPEAIGAATAALQTVPVTSTPVVEEPSVAAPVAAAVGTMLPTQTVPVTETAMPKETQLEETAAAVSAGTPTQTVEVTAKPAEPDEFEAILKPPALVPPVAEIPIPEVKIAEPAKPPISTADLIKLLSLVATGAGTGMMGGGQAPIRSTPVSDSMLGSTTPQFGSDYYSAIQRYYNAYMPQYPRDVAGPLQQWYENKYGA